MDNKEKLHILLSGDFPPLPGGQSRFLYNLIYYLPASSKAVITFYAPGAEEIDRALSFPVRRVHFKSGRKKIFLFFLPWIYLFYLLPYLRKKPIIHCGQAMVAGAASLLAKKLFRIPYVLYTYGAEFLRYHKFPLNIFFKLLFKNAYKIVAISQYTEDQIKKLNAPPEKIIRTLLGVEADIFHPLKVNPGFKKKYGLEGKRIILTACRLDAHKGMDMVIKALPSVLLEHPDIVYVIVGSGEDESRLKKIAEEEGVKEKVIFTGFLPDKELVLFLNSSVLFIMPTREVSEGSHVDGFGICYIEANACGRPAVGGRSGGVSDAILDGETGLLVNPESVNEITQVLNKLLEDEDFARELGQNGLLRVQKNLTWEKLIPLLFKQF